MRWLIYHYHWYIFHILAITFTAWPAIHPTFYVPICRRYYDVIIPPQELFIIWECVLSSKESILGAYVDVIYNKAEVRRVNVNFISVPHINVYLTVHWARNGITGSISAAV